MKVNTYRSWKDTNITLHMLLQMMGKVKLDKMTPQPEWNHALLYPTPQGFTTGLVPDAHGSFEIRLNLDAPGLEARCTSGAHAGFALKDGVSVSQYYDMFQTMLNYVGHPCGITSAPQEVFFTTPFEEQTTAVNFDGRRAWEYFETCVFAHNALLAFSAPFRGKKIPPSLFWGTFDMTTVLFSGAELAFPGEGIIEQVAFDERFVEFGFWPGDEKLDDPSFFVLPYPFVDNEPENDIQLPKGAAFVPEKKEYIFALKDVLAHDDPQQALVDFCRGSFSILANADQWDGLDWFNKPLLV